ncbi:hypothetical protein Tco_0635893 [Tanacetum coccineum]
MLEVKLPLLMVLGLRLKTAYVTSDVLSAQWDRCIDVVLTWIMNHVSIDVYMGLVYSVDVAYVWKELKSTYDKGICNVPPNGVFGNEVYGSDSEGFDVNPSSNEFRLCNSDEWRSGNLGGRVIICGYGGGGDMVVRHGLKGCLDHRIIRSSPILPPLP